MADADWIREFRDASSAELHGMYVHDKELIGEVLGHTVLDGVSDEDLHELREINNDLALHFTRTRGFRAQRIIDYGN